MKCLGATTSSGFEIWWAYEPHVKKFACAETQAAIAALPATAHKMVRKLETIRFLLGWQQVP